ncbi:MAG: sigma-70 family RNA polymerase sigma factor [Clostridia bacterium]|nr:sigma-70 family RNA polymerase sigma factor [Clostridia bacterium]
MNRKTKTPLPEKRGRGTETAVLSAVDPPDTELDGRAADDLASHTDRDARQAADVLVKRAVQGDEAAFGVLVETYERFVYHTALRVLRMCGGRAEDGEDVAQNAFLKAWRSLSTFRGDCAFSTWLYRITVNCARDHCRMESRHPTTSLSLSDEEDEPFQIDVPVTDGDQVPESAMERKETIRMVRKAIQALPEDMRTVILLRDIEELSYADIAGLLHLEVGTVKSRINRGRTALKEALADLLHC